MPTIKERLMALETQTKHITQSLSKLEAGQSNIQDNVSKIFTKLGVIEVLTLDGNKKWRTPAITGTTLGVGIMAAVAAVLRHFGV